MLEVSNMEMFDRTANNNLTWQVDNPPMLSYPCTEIGWMREGAQKTHQKAEWDEVLVDILSPTNTS